MTRWPEHIAGVTTHARRGDIRNAFRYSVDYVLIDPDARAGPALFSRNWFNLTSVQDRHHGGRRGEGRGVAWAREVFEVAGLPREGIDVLLLTQPGFLGYVFNPVSFWLAVEGDALRAVIAEVNNTFGDRHSYLCYRDGFAPIGPETPVETRKVFHVSPFQDIAGDYRFNFDIGRDRIAIRIAHTNAGEGVIATLAGARRPLRNQSMLAASLRRPFGALRTIGLIYWQALRLKLKGARYRSRPAPPEQEVS